jgi:hypothetical protein
LYLGDTGQCGDAKNYLRVYRNGDNADQRNDMYCRNSLDRQPVFRPQPNLHAQHDGCEYKQRNLV